MIKQILAKLLRSLKSTAVAHKKKLIFLAILFLGYKIIRRKVKTQNIIQVAMFFIRIWSKIIQFLPLPTEEGYRYTQAFQYVPHTQIKQLGTLVDIKSILMKMKKKQQGSFEQLKLSILSSLALNLVLYKVPTIYTLIYQKYKQEFQTIGDHERFYNAMQYLKKQYIMNLQSFRHFIAKQISDKVENVDLQQMYSVEKVQKLVKTIADSLFVDVVDIGGRVMAKRTSFSVTRPYKVAQNYFKTTKNYIQQNKSGVLSKIFKAVTFAPRLAYSCVSYVMRQPQQVLTSQRFCLNQFLYVLPLKKLSLKSGWSCLQSEHLFNFIVQQLITYFYSINFNIVSYRNMQLQTRIFNNRMRIYFQKRVGERKQKKMLDLLPAIYKIIQEQLIMEKNRKQFYERQLLAAFRDTHFPLSHNITPLSEYQLRNHILQQIYYKNELQHLEKDMQSKLYNERDHMAIEPVAKVNSRVYEQKDQIQQLMQIYDKRDQVGGTTREQMQMMRELTDNR